MAKRYRRATFLEFCAQLGLRFEGEQANVAAVLFDGAAPAPVDPDARAPISGLPIAPFGFTGPPPPEARQAAVLLAGVRSFKSRVGALRLLHLSMTVELGDDIAPGEVPVCSFTAPLERQARTPWRYAQGQALAHPDIARYVVQSSAEKFVVASPINGRHIAFECFAASAGGDTLRSNWHVGGYVDEAAFYDGEGAAVTDIDTVGALEERIYPGGQMVIGTSTWAKRGLVYQLHQENFASPENAIVAQASTDMLRTNPHVLELMARQKRKAERRGTMDEWEREWCARFLDLGSRQVYDETTVRLACPWLGGPDVDRSLRAGDHIVAAADLAFSQDHAALVIVRVRLEPTEVEGDDGKPRVVQQRHYTVLHVEELAPPSGGVLEPSATLRRFAAIMRGYRVRSVMADVHYIESLYESTKGTGIGVVPTSARPDQIHMNARNAMRDGRVALLNDERLLHQLTLVTRRPAGGNRWTIDIPRGMAATGGAGGHGDVAVAFATALQLARGAEVAPPPPTPEQLADAEVEASIRKVEESVLGRRGRRRIAP